MGAEQNSLWRWLKGIFSGDNDDEAKRPSSPPIPFPQVEIETTRSNTAVAPDDIDAVYLRQKMSNYLDEDQLSQMGQQLGVDYAALPGGKGRKVLVFIETCQRQNRLRQLLALCRQLDDSVPWQPS